MELRRIGLATILSCVTQLDRISTDDATLRDIVVKRLRSAISHECWQTIEDFECDVLNESGEVDRAFVKTCRILISKFLLSHQDKSYDGFSIRDIPSWYGKR